MTAIVSFSYGNLKCEIICKKETVLAYRNKKLSIDDVLTSDEIYKNASKGNILSVNEFTYIFGNISKQEALQIILKKGNYKLTTYEIRQQLEDKRKQLVHYIKSNYTQANGKSHSYEQIDSVLSKCKVKLNPIVSCEHIFKQYRNKIENYITLKVARGLQTTYTIPYNIYGKIQNMIHPYQINIQYTDSDVVIEVDIPHYKIESITNLMNKYNI